MGNDIFKEQNLLAAITEMVEEDHNFMAKLINHVNDFYAAKKTKAREQSGKYYLSCSLLMSIMLKRKNIKLSELEISLLNASLPELHDTDCQAFKLFHERFNIRGGQDGKS